MRVSALKTSLWFNRFVAAAMFILLFALPGLLRWYAALRPGLGHTASLAIRIGFYCAAVPVFLALWNLDGLLRRILARQVFIRANVRAISTVRWCCLAVASICLTAACFYPPLIFLTVIMVFLTLILSVLRDVMAAAVEIREENDLTV